MSSNSHIKNVQIPWFSQNCFAELDAPICVRVIMLWQFLFIYSLQNNNDLKKVQAILAKAVDVILLVVNIVSETSSKNNKMKEEEDGQKEEKDDSLLKAKRKRKKKHKERLKIEEEVIPLRVLSK